MYIFRIILIILKIPDKTTIFDSFVLFNNCLIQRLYERKTLLLQIENHLNPS